MQSQSTHQILKHLRLPTAAGSSCSLCGELELLERLSRRRLAGTRSVSESDARILDEDGGR